MPPVDATAPYVLSIAGAAYVVAMFVQVTKFLISYAIKPTDPNQNNVVRMYVFMVSIAVVVGVDFLTYHLTSRTDILNALANSLNVGAVAIASYHLLTSNDMPTPVALPVMEATPAPIVPVIAETKPAPVIPPVEVAPQG